MVYLTRSTLPKQSIGQSRNTFSSTPQVVKKSLVTFVNKHLNKINLEVYDLDSQFSDGVHLCLLAGLLEGYFVPLYDFHLTPQVRVPLR